MRDVLYYQTMAEREYICPRFSARFIEGELNTPFNVKVEVNGRKFDERAATIALMDCPVPECPIKCDDRTADGRIELNAAKTAVLKTAKDDSLLKAKEGAQKHMLANCARIDKHPRSDRAAGRYKAPPFGR